MDQATHSKIVSFIWGIADDVLRDLFKRGKYPDVILPMCVLRRFDAVLEPTKKAVLEAKETLDKAGIVEQTAALCGASVQAFYNTSKFTLRDLKSRGSQQQLLADFEDYLNGFSPNVQDIIDNFKLRNQLSTLSKADALGTLINKFLDPEIDLSPEAIDNHAMGTIFEELVRRFNEDNNEEAGEHWTPRDAIRLMANLVFAPVAQEIRSGSYLLYDGAIGTGGMLTIAEETLVRLARERGLQIKTHLYGQEINPETYAICKADMLLKGEGENADHIVGGRGMVHVIKRCVRREELRFYVFESAVRKKLEKRSRVHGRQGRAARSALSSHAPRRRALVSHAFKRRPDVISRKHGFENEPRDATRQPYRRGPQRLVTLHGRCRPGREQRSALPYRERLA
jgi:type I restriction enzyme M protein